MANAAGHEPTPRVPAKGGGFGESVVEIPSRVAGEKCCCVPGYVPDAAFGREPGAVIAAKTLGIRVLASSSSKRLYHVNDRENLSIGKRDGYIFTTFITFERVERNARERRAHLQAAKPRSTCGIFTVLQDQSP